MATSYNRYFSVGVCLELASSKIPYFPKLSFSPFVSNDRMCLGQNQLAAHGFHAEGKAAAGVILVGVVDV